MNTYTATGMGDGTRMDTLEDDRPQCKHCDSRFDVDDAGSDVYCTVSHWHLGSLGIIKNEIQAWLKWEYPLFKMIGLFDVCYAPYMSDSSVGRWKRAIIRMVNL